MNERKTQDGIIPLSKRDNKRITFSVEKNIFIQVIILLIITICLLGCAVDKGPKEVFCQNGFDASQGWVSSEQGGHYWVVDDRGQIMEFNKRNCSIVG